MKFFSAAAMAEMSEDVPAARATLLPHWVEGPHIAAQPGEVHLHGALGDGPFAHLTVTTLGYQFPAAPVDAGPVDAGPIAPSA